MCVPSARLMSSTAYLQPYSGGRDWIMVSALAFTAVITPVEVSFMGSASEHVSFLWVMNRLIDIIFMTDIFITFNLAYQVHHHHHRHRTRIHTYN